jgi:hypothetical protein
MVTTSDEIRDLLNLSTALATAVNSRFMSPEHGATIWKTFLKKTSVDVQKTDIKTIKRNSK